MVLPLVSALVLGLFQDRPIVKQTLPNGATVYAKRIEGAKTFSIVLAAVSLTPGETEETHGMRHLLEHLLAKGPKHDVDSLLESRGMVLKAETTRDAVVFEVSGPRSELSIAVESLKRVVSKLATTPEELKKEIGILRQEAVLRPWALLLISDAWLKAFGLGELDPFGSPEKLDGMSIEALQSASEKLLNPAGLSVAVAGDIEAESTSNSAAQIVRAFPAGESVEPVWRLPAKATVFAGSLDGEAVSVPVGPLTNPETASTIAAAFGLRAWLSGCQSIYTPSARNSLVTVALRTGLTWRAAAAQLRGKEGLVAQTGLRLLNSWRAEVERSPSLTASITASVLPLRPGFSIESFLTSLERPGRPEVEAAVKAFIAGGIGE